MSSQSNPPQKDTLNISTLKDKLKQLLFELGTEYESLGAKGDEAELNKYTDQILALLKDTIKEAIGEDEVVIRIDRKTDNDIPKEVRNDFRADIKEKLGVQE